MTVAVLLDVLNLSCFCEPKLLTSEVQPQKCAFLSPDNMKIIHAFRTHLGDLEIYF